MPWLVPDVGDTDPARQAKGASPQWGGAFDKIGDDALKWGSVFDDKDGGRLRWGSVFDAQREPTKWGFDDTEWGAGFGPKRNSEPTITVG